MSTESAADNPREARYHPSRGGWSAGAVQHVSATILRPLLFSQVGRFVICEIEGEGVERICRVDDLTLCDGPSGVPDAV